MMASIVFHDGKWTEGDPPLLSAMSHAVWLSSIVFDGARAFEGVATPALPRVQHRGMIPTLDTEQALELLQKVCLESRSGGGYIS